MIQLFKPSIGDAEIEAVIRVLKSGWLGLGPETTRFEEEFAQAMDVKHAIALNSGTAALHLALRAVGVRTGDEVIVPALTFVSTAHAVIYNGGIPVFADVCPDTLNIDVQDVKRKITARTRAIVPVHYGGHPCDMDELHALAVDQGIAIVEDAAHACGATYKGRKIGSVSKVTCFSFHAVKNLTTGEGGLVTTTDSEIDAQLRRWRWMGITRDTWSRTTEGEVYAWRYSVEDLGFKCHMHDLAAAIGRVQLRRLEELNARRRRLVERYNDELARLPWVECPVQRSYVESSWHIYHVKLDSRDELIAHLKKNDIAPGVHYYPLHLYPYFQPSDAHLPVTEREWKRIISLPLYPDMSEDDQGKVIEAIRQFGRERGL